MASKPTAHRPKVLVLSRNFPNNVFETLGLWVERQVSHSTHYCDPKVIAPVAYAPPFSLFGDYYARFRQIKPHQWMTGIEVFYPRYFIGPGYSAHNIESLTYYLGICQRVKKLSQTFRFDLIHAHFIYPDGVVAAWLGRQYKVPVVITEHARWQPWLDNYPIVRRQALWAAGVSQFLIAPSKAARDSMVHFISEAEKLRVIPDPVDDTLFALRTNGTSHPSNQILFIGLVRPVKGLDILLSAMRILVKDKPELCLVVAGEAYYQNYRKEYERLRGLVDEWGLTEHVRFVGKKVGAELVTLVQSSDLLVLPSRAETLGVVLLEALACGIPVVATHCGGPEDIVNENVGVLVPSENPEALALGIEHVLARLHEYNPALLREYALEHFGLESVGRRIAALYSDAIARHQENRVGM